MYNNDVDETNGDGGDKTSNRRRSCKSEYHRVNGSNGKLGLGGQGRSLISTSDEMLARSRSHQNNDYDETTRKLMTTSSGKTLSSQQISEIGNILAKTKEEIHRKLNDLKAAAIRVQLEGTQK